jgi:hypothetical protein
MRAGASADLSRGRDAPWTPRARALRLVGRAILRWPHCLGSGCGHSRRRAVAPTLCAHCPRCRLWEGVRDCDRGHGYRGSRTALTRSRDPPGHARRSASRVPPVPAPTRPSAGLPAARGCHAGRATPRSCPAGVHRRPCEVEDHRARDMRTRQSRHPDAALLGSASRRRRAARTRCRR